MKWIGQHIWDLISRFRSDVYLDNIEDGTVANDKFLGLDANNKIVKEAASTTVTNLNSAGVNGSANQMLTDNGDGTVTSESTCLFSTDVGQQFWVSGTAPYINVSNNTNDDQPGRLQFFNTRSGNNGVDGDGIGQMNFIGSDSGGNITSFARIESSIVTALHTDEAGKLELKSATSDGGSPSGSTLQQALTATGHGTNNTIDIGLGYGTASTTTIAGDLDIDGDTITSAGVLKIIPADVNGLALHIDADADTDNEVQIDAGLLDVNTTGSITMDAADDITISATDNATFRGEDDVTISATSADGKVYISSAHTAGTSIHIDATEDAGSIVDIDAGILDIDATQSVSIKSGGSCEFISDTSRYYKSFDFQSTTFENNFSSGDYSGKILRYSPGADATLTSGQIYYLRGNGQWYQAHADDDGGGGPGYGDSQLLGVGLGSSSQTVGVLLEGFVRIPSTEILNQPTGGASGNVDGLPLYVSTTAGHFDFNAPTDSGDYVRIVGYAIDDHSNDILVYFNPSKTYIEIA